jgi:hypothetical protein
MGIHQFLFLERAEGYGQVNLEKLARLNLSERI